jgi:FkbM family methyltransferase
MNELVKHRWLLDGGNEMRYKYALDEKSVVVDVGGYVGEFTSEINNRYGCEIYVIEPVKEFSNFLHNRFLRFNNIESHNVALCAGKRSGVISISKDASSIHQDFGVKQDIQCLGFSDFLAKVDVDFVDLIKINIEGEEYNLLDDMCVSGDVLKCDNIQVQFHDFIPNHESKYSDIKVMLSETHELTYYYPYLWENWRLKDKSYSQVGQDKWVLSQFPNGYRGFFLDLGC